MSDKKRREAIRQMEEEYEQMRQHAANLYAWARENDSLDIYALLMAQSAALMISEGISRAEAVQTVISLMPMESRHLFPRNFDNLTFREN